ncbi:MAG: major facilitator superfamily 1 [Chthonomonadaceae bacterium]|nr:major facilitator superfamily 1 [Chthonomonadaceae bacterium]
MSRTHNSPPAKAPFERADVLRLGCLVAVSVLLRTLINALVGEKTVFLYKETLHLSASHITVLHLVLGLPTYIQPFLGAWTEIIPWLGYHRRPYYFCGVLAAALSYLALAALHAYHYGTILLLMLAVGSGWVLSAVVYNAAFVAIGNRTGLLPRLQSLALTLPLLLSTFYSSHLGGFVAEHWTYSLTYSAAGALTLLMLPLVFLMDDRRVPHSVSARLSTEAMAARTARRTQSMAVLRKALKSRGLWIFTAYLAYLSLTPDPVTARLFYETDSLHFSKQFIGDLGRYQSVGTLLGLGVIALLARFTTLRVATLWTWLGNCIIYLCYFGIRDHASAKLAFLIMGLNFGFLGVLEAALVARACPRGAEATVFGLIASVKAFFYLLCDYFGTKMYDLFGPLNTAHHYTIAHGWNTSVAVGLACAVVQGAFLPFLPAWTRSRTSLATPQTDEV